MPKETEFDVVIAGAGPGGSTCAMYCARKGYKVLLLDKAKFPRDKTCGDAISGKSVRVLHDLGLSEHVKKVKHTPIHGVTFSSPEGVVVSIPFRTAPGQEKGTGYCIRREEYDNFLFEHASKEKNVTVKQETAVTDLIWEGDRLVGLKAKGKDGKEAEYYGKVVVGADGAQSMVATKLGLNKVVPKHHCTAARAYYSGIKDLTNDIEIHFIKTVMPGYFWIFPLENGMANVGIGMVTEDVQKRKLNMVKSMFDAIEHDPLFKERFKHAKLIDGTTKGWTLPFGSGAPRKAHGHGWVLLGDAASLIDPFSGEGVGNAMTSAKFATKYIDSAIKSHNFSAAHFAGYQKELWDEIGDELKSSYQLQRIGRIEFLLNLVIHKTAKSKQVRDTISQMLDDREQKTQLVSPLFYLKLLFA